MDPHLLKIKHLLSLATSPNENEAAAAKAMAEKLILKFNVTESQLRDIELSDKPIYSDDNLMHESETLEDWKNILALVVAQKYDCYAIQENNVAKTSDGTTACQTYKYYVYGDEQDVPVAKELFRYVYSEVERIIRDRCPDRGRIYRDSFCEGVIKGVRQNIENEDFAITGTVKQAPVREVKPDAIAPVVEERKPRAEPPAIQERANTNTSTEKELDMMAFVIGEQLGRDIHIDRTRSHNKRIGLIHRLDPEPKKGPGTRWERFADMIKAIGDQDDDIDDGIDDFDI